MTRTLLSLSILGSLVAPIASAQTPMEVREARREARQARQEVREAREERRDAVGELIEAAEETSEALLEAGEARRESDLAVRALRDALQTGDANAITDARRALREAHEERRDARDDVRDGRRDTREARREVREGVRDVRDATRDARHALRDARRATRRARVDDPESWRAVRRGVRTARWVQIRRALGAGNALPSSLDANLRDELRRHARRVADLDRIGDIASDRDDKTALDRVEELMDLELARHAAALARHGVRLDPNAIWLAEDPTRALTNVSGAIEAAQDATLNTADTTGVANEALGHAAEQLQRALGQGAQ